jgi:Zn-dependent M28 family amino/carboxypeptidase
MRCAQALILLAAATLAPAQHKFSGESALRFTEKVVSFGARPAGSQAHRKTLQYIEAQARQAGCQVETQEWTAQTPSGPKPMRNVIARAPGTTKNVVVISGHYDTKPIPGIHFVGANDAGSSTGLLLEFARVLCSSKGQDAVWLVWLDGEEALGPNWTADDSLYGSRRLAAKWANDGTAKRIKALMNVDMIGDRDLALVYEWNSTEWLRDLIWSCAAELGYAKHFPRKPGAIDDDHMPFLRSGIAAVDLIDFEYGPNNSWWHTDRDTVDKLSARSFEIVGQVLLRTVRKLGEKN